MKLLQWFQKRKKEVAQDKTVDYEAAEKPNAHMLQNLIELYRPPFAPKERTIDIEELKKYILYSIVLGDVSGSRYEGVQYPHSENYQTIDLFTQYHRFTDDTALTVAVYKATQKIQTEKITDEDDIVNIYAEYLRQYTRLYPSLSYGGGFLDWALSERSERNSSYGNGACMRVGGISLLFDSVEDVIRYAYYSALPTHSHEEGIKGAICTSVIYWMLSHGATKDDILQYLQKQYPANNGRRINGETTLKDLVAMNEKNPWATLSVICQTSLPEAVINFLESDSFESCLRNSYRYLCDRDTISAIAAPMAAIYYQDISVSGLDGEEIAKEYLDEKLLADIGS